jgi:hypothetical protein
MKPNIGPGSFAKDHIFGNHGVLMGILRLNFSCMLGFRCALLNLLQLLVSALATAKIQLTFAGELGRLSALGLGC